MFNYNSNLITRVLHSANHKFCKAIAKNCIVIVMGVVYNAQCLAEDEVFLATLNGDELVSVNNISNRIGYDNQPHFTPDSKAVLFTSEFANADNGVRQTDSMRYDIATKQLSNISNTPNASEYSPTVTPDGKNFSMIRVAGDGKQLLWQYPLNVKEVSATNKAKQLSDIHDVGYHLWLNNDDLLLFVLGEPMVLQRTSLSLNKSTMVDTNIGRTLRKVPNKALFSYTKGSDKGSTLMLFNPTDNSTKATVLLPKQNMYYAWHQTKGNVLTAEKNTVVSIDLSHDLKTATWQPWLNFAEYCSGYITRMKMSDDGQYFAFVCVTEDEK
ncbi:TolB family protein [Thalassotalea crassostreae]|uniref:TolB family protein n=1 Tax=Thalassotalea crassostreae TaxID=1763536 RepID=UPI000838FC87|nr:hypothetical protein [Thalassotalea crassostreae]